MIDSDDEAGSCSIVNDSDCEAGGCSDVSGISSNSVRTFGSSYRVLRLLGRCVNADKQLPVFLPRYTEFPRTNTLAKIKTTQPVFIVFLNMSYFGAISMQLQ